MPGIKIGYCRENFNPLPGQEFLQGGNAFLKLVQSVFGHGLPVILGQPLLDLFIAGNGFHSFLRNSVHGFSVAGKEIGADDNQ